MALGTKISCNLATVTWNSALIGNPISFSGLGGAVAKKDRTTLASTAEECVPGIPAYGQLTVNVFRDNDDAGSVVINAGYIAGTVAPL